MKAGGAGAAKKPKTPKKKGGGKAAGSNTISAEDAADAFEEVFKLKSELASVSGEIRKRIADEYATIAKRLEVPKKIVKHQVALEEHRRKTAKFEAEFDARDRDALLKLAQVFGEDSPFGEFAMRAASRAKRDGFSGDGDEGAGAAEEGGEGGEGPEEED